MFTWLTGKWQTVRELIKNTSENKTDVTCLDYHLWVFGRQVVCNKLVIAGKDIGNQKLFGVSYWCTSSQQWKFCNGFLPRFLVSYWKLRIGKCHERKQPVQLQLTSLNLWGLLGRMWAPSPWLVDCSVSQSYFSAVSMVCCCVDLKDLRWYHVVCSNSPTCYLPQVSLLLSGIWKHKGWGITHHHRGQDQSMTTTPSKSQASCCLNFSVDSCLNFSSSVTASFTFQTLWQSVTGWPDLQSCISSPDSSSLFLSHFFNSV
jgi:hypothetical protein